jgi:threonine aldolase
MSGASPAVRMTGDGPEPTPAEQAALLARLTNGRGCEADQYGAGQLVAECEALLAEMFGKPRALLLPSGTLANHLAVRALAGGRSRVIVQEASHLWNDCGDALQALSGLALVALGAGRGSFTWREVEAELARAAEGRVATGVGVVSIESPIRRRLGELFDAEALAPILAGARALGIATHLDGARLPVAAAYAGRAPAALAAGFDTVYVSLWKCFGTGSGAVLAGPAEVIEQLVDERRRFGGALRAFWPIALVARHHAPGFVARLAAAIPAAEALFDGLAGLPGLAVERVMGGTNVAVLRLAGRDPGRFRARLLEQGVLLPAPEPGAGADTRFVIRVNETWSRIEPKELGAAIARAAD